MYWSESTITLHFYPIFHARIWEHSATNSAIAPVKSASITPTEGMQKSDPKRGEVAQGNAMTEPGTQAVKALAAPAPVKGNLFSCSFSFFSGGWRKY